MEEQRKGFEKEGEERRLSVWCFWMRDSAAATAAAVGLEMDSPEAC